MEIDYKKEWDTLKERLEVAVLGFDMKSMMCDNVIERDTLAYTAGVVRGVLQYMDEVDSGGKDG